MHGLVRLGRSAAVLVSISCALGLLPTSQAGAQQEPETVAGCSLLENTSDHRIRVTDDRKYSVPRKNAPSQTVNFSAGVVQTLPYPGNGDVLAVPVYQPITVPAQGGGTWTWDLPGVRIECLKLYIGTTMIQWFAHTTGQFFGEAIYDGVENCEELSPSPEEESLGGPSEPTVEWMVPDCMDPEDDGSGGSGAAVSGNEPGLYCDLLVTWDEWGNVVMVEILWETCETREE